MRYAVVIEDAGRNYSAYVPDLPSCVATAATIGVIEEQIREAKRFHIEGLQADASSIPALKSRAHYVDA